MIITKNLYFSKYVFCSLAISLLKKKRITEVFFWGNEIYESDMQFELWDFIWILYFDFYAINNVTIFNTIYNDYKNWLKTKDKKEDKRNKYIKQYSIYDNLKLLRSRKINTTVYNTFEKNVKEANKNEFTNKRGRAPKYLNHYNFKDKKIENKKDKIFIRALHGENIDVITRLIIMSEPQEISKYCLFYKQYLEYNKYSNKYYNCFHKLIKLNKEENIDCHKIKKRILLCCIKLNFIHKNKQSGKSINSVSNRKKCSFKEKIQISLYNYKWEKHKNPNHMIEFKRHYKMDEDVLLLKLYRYKKDDSIPRSLRNSNNEISKTSKTDNINIKCNYYDFIDNWEYYCRDTPLWDKRFVSFKVSFDEENKKIIHNDGYYKFTDTYGYELQEQKPEILNYDIIMMMYNNIGRKINYKKESIRKMFSGV